MWIPTRVEQSRVSFCADELQVNEVTVEQCNHLKLDWRFACSSLAMAFDNTIKIFIVDSNNSPDGRRLGNVLGKNVSHRLSGKFRVELTEQVGSNCCIGYWLSYKFCVAREICTTHADLPRPLERPLASARDWYYHDSIPSRRVSLLDDYIICAKLYGALVIP